MIRLLCLVSVAGTALSSESVTIDISNTGEMVRPELYGHNFEFTRHDNFEGLMAEMISNRKFAVPPSCSTSTTSYKCWPQQLQDMMAEGFIPRWTRIGKPTLDQPYWAEHSSLVTGDMGHSIHCSKDQGECGVEQGSYFDGFNSGMSFGSALVLQGGTEYKLRIVSRGENTPALNVSFQATETTYTQEHSTEDTAVCDESARIKASCDNCGPDWGDLGQCQALCDAKASCNYVTFFANDGCRMYSACDRTWDQKYGMKSTIYKKASSDVVTIAHFQASPTSSWTTIERSFTAAATASNTVLKIVGAGEWWLGSVSLIPMSNNWRGMRRDVVDALKSTGFHGLFRYPGGCFAPFYRWQVGLLDPDMRPPISTPHDYCAAVGGGVNAYTDGSMQNGLGIDDFLALVEELDAEPAITLRLQDGSDDEITEAAAWVEYCNGDATTKWGGVRASRGRAQPYNVKYWYLGNEMSQQVRYPSYPADMTKLGHPNKTEYATMLSSLVPAVLKASPKLPLKLFAVAGTGPATAQAAWNAAWADAVGKDIYATSSHEGYTNGYTTDEDFTAQKVTDALKRVSTQGEFVKSLETLHQSLNGTGKDIVISADEWGLGPPWEASTFGAPHGMYAASFLSAVTRVGPSVNLRHTNYFEAVNEGAITVRPFDAKLTPVGQVFGLYAQHQGGSRILTSPVDADGNLDVLATLHPDKTIVATVANLNAVEWTTYKLIVQLAGSGTTFDDAAATELKAQGFTQASMFETSHYNVKVSGSKLELSVPPLSVIHLTLNGRSSALYV